MKSSKIMPLVTATLLLALLAYAFAWYTERVKGDFTIALLVLTVLTFVYWLYDKLFLRPKRVQEAKNLEAQIKANNSQASEQELTPKILAAIEPVLTPPWWIEWTAGFFWVILFVFVLRSFVIEPYKIPSGSMMPTLEAGDFILVSKFGYGVRVPVLNTKIIDVADPKRGDVIVFRLPTDESITYIKRIVGLPGDEVSYHNKQLTINGQLIAQVQIDDYVNTENSYPVTDPQYEEALSDTPHRILVHRNRYTMLSALKDSEYFVGQRPYAQNCKYRGQDFVCTVPQGYYFVMGDNRDNSVDSRYWGFVPEGNIVGKAFFIWMNFGKLNRIGAFN